MPHMCIIIQTRKITRDFDSFKLRNLAENRPFLHTFDPHCVLFPEIIETSIGYGTEKNI